MMMRTRLRDYAGMMSWAVTKSRALSNRSSSRIKSLAVMPFANANDDPEMEYLSDGITESVIHSLSRVGKRLRVMARSTVFTYKGKSPTPQQLGAELGVTQVVTGRVQHVGTTIVISIELVNTRDGSQIWGNRFRTPFSDIFDVQDQIATQISDQLRLQLTSVERKRLAHRATKKSEAYELYLKGRYHANKRTIEGVKRAIEEFEKAIQIDPLYALAHSGLADCYAIISSRFLASPAEGYARAEMEARRAVELDPSLAEPHATIGHVSLCYKWNWIEADHELRRAIGLDPGYATAHHWYSAFLGWMNRLAEALEQARQSIELEPLSLLLNVNYADLLYFAERYDDALEHVRKTLDVENYFLAHLLKSRIYAVKGMYGEAAGSIETAIGMVGRYPELVAGLGYIYGMRGDNKKARAILAELRTMAENDFVAPSFFAEVYLALGDYDKALEHAEEWFRMRGELAELLVGPRFAPLRRDYRFSEMLTRVGFPDRSVLSSPAFAPTATL